MRITQNGMKKQYLRNSNSALERMSKINNRILTERKFMRASEDSTAAANAMIIRKSLSNLDMYEANIKNVQALYSSAESHIMTISEKASNVTTQLIYGVNGDKSDTERSIIARELENFAEQMKTELNDMYSDRQIFGGTNNSSVPITYDEATRTVSYNGVPVNAMLTEETDAAGNTICKFNGNTITDPDKIKEGKVRNYNMFPNSDPIYVDVGIGIKYEYEKDANGNEIMDTAKVNPDTAINVALNACEMTGSGVDEDGDSRNIIQLTFDAAEALRNGDKETCWRLLDKIYAAQEEVLIGLTNFGAKSESLDFHLDKVETDRYNLQVQQKEIEAADLTQEITDYKSAQAAYNATLQMGSSVLPSSIFDFIR